jgi:cytochrome c biogenesis protein CcdA
MSFLLGIVISVGEFLCAGQIYLATIAYMIQNQRALTLQAFLYLLIYDIGFVLPMLIITVMIERGRELFDISEVLRKKLPLIKLIFAIAFVLLAVAIIFLS